MNPLKQLSLIFTLWVLILSASGQTPFEVNEYSIDLNKYPSYNFSDVQNALANVKTSEFFDYGYLNSGCNYKSHYVNLWLKKKLGMQTFKIWSLSKSVYYYSGYNDRLSVPDPNNLTESGKVEWGYHVALGILVKRHEKNKDFIDTMIVDMPTNSVSPISLKEWFGIQNQKNLYYTFTESKFCNFETLVPAIFNSQTNQLEKLNPSFNTFAGRFWDDGFTIQNSILSKNLAIDIVVMKYYKERVVKDNLLVQQGQMLNQGPPQWRISIKAQHPDWSGQQIEDEVSQQSREILNSMKKRKLELTKVIADYNHLSLPDEYNNQIVELTAKIQNHILNDLVK